MCVRNREKGILEKCSECLRDASTEVGEGALSQVVLRFAGRVDILDLTPCWKGRCWGWGEGFAFESLFSALSGVTGRVFTAA